MVAPHSSGAKNEFQVGEREGKQGLTGKEVLHSKVLFEEKCDREELADDVTGSSA